MFDISFSELITVILVSIITMDYKDIGKVYKVLKNFTANINAILKNFRDSLNAELKVDDDPLGNHSKKILAEFKSMKRKSNSNEDIKPNIKKKEL